MSAISPGEVSRAVRKKKVQTQTTKAHRFEPFSKRVAKLKIDPVHTVQTSKSISKEQDLTKSCFKTCLDENAELNLSQNFTSFRSKVNPLCENLPQILHHADKIVDILLEHISNGDKLSLEPLLALTAQLAHDLGRSFEPYFNRTMNLILQTAASQEDPEAIEWAFECLAWIFKYLSRLLVLDLRPLLKVMLPYMNHRKEYIRRFTAESLAFLIRKAAILSKKQAKPLRFALEQLFEPLDPAVVSDEGTSRQALMILLAESAMGVDAQLHSCSVDLLNCTFETCVMPNVGFPNAVEVLQGMLIYLIHRTDAEGFRPMLHEIIRRVELVSSNQDSKRSMLSIRLLLIVIGSRRGTRVDGWTDLLQSILRVRVEIPRTNTTGLNQDSDMILAVALVLQNCPMPDLLPVLDQVISSVMDELPARLVFAFCELVAGLGQQRFQDLLLPRLQNYIITHWSGNESSLCLLSRELVYTKAINNVPMSKGFLSLPTVTNRVLAEQIGAALIQDNTGVKNVALVDLGRWLRVFGDPAIEPPLSESLWQSAVSSLMTPNEFNTTQRLKLGRGLQWIINSTTTSESYSGKLWTLVQNQPLERYQHVPFIEACIDLAKILRERSFLTEDKNKLCHGLLSNMLNQSYDLKRHSLNLLKIIYRGADPNAATSIFDVLLDILTTRYAIANARKLSMLIRRLPQQHFELIAENSKLTPLIPQFLLGCLTEYHDSLRKDVCLALGDIVRQGDAENIIFATIESWLQSSELSAQVPLRSSGEDDIKASDFSCLHFSSAKASISNCMSKYNSPDSEILKIFESENQLQTLRTPRENRAVALQFLLVVPDLAARRSRVVIPAFLASQQGSLNRHVPASTDSISSHTLSPDMDKSLWSLRDRKLYLELMGKFNNPSVLYRASEVKVTLLEGLTNGNPDIRRLSLEALLTWKDPFISDYKDILLKVAEDKNATNELSQLLSTNKEDTTIESTHRSSVLPVLLRIVFGQIIGRVGVYGSQEGKRKTILRLLFRMDESEVSMFLEITLGRLREISVPDSKMAQHQMLDHDVINPDQQYGFLRMMLSMFEILRTKFQPYGAIVLDSILYCTFRACRQLNGSGTAQSNSALTRNIRKTGLQCIVDLFSLCQNLEWDRYVPSIFAHIVGPRLPKFEEENAQGISGLLRLFSAWSQSKRLVHMLYQHEANLLQHLWGLLGFPSSQSEVKIFIIEEIIKPLVELTGSDDKGSQAATFILRSEIDQILSTFLKILQNSPTRDVVSAIIFVLPSLTPFTQSLTSANHLLACLIGIFNEKSYKMPPHVKGQVLKAIQGIVEVSERSVVNENMQPLFQLVCRSFDYFKDEPNRQILCRVLQNLASCDARLAASAELCDHLNAVSNKGLDDIDFETRITAFNKIGELSTQHGSSFEWLPILYNLLYFARTSEDFAIRSNAVSKLRYFIQDVYRSQEVSMKTVVEEVLLPTLLKGTRHDSELVRADFVSLYGMVVRFSDIPQLEDLKVLLVGNDEEASFFSNILHVQQHRRVRAINRLVTETESGKLKPDNIAHFFIPLLQKFIYDQSEQESQNSVKGNSITAYATLVRWIDWPSFKTLLRQRKQEIMDASNPNKTTIKLLGNVVEALQSACDLKEGLEVLSDRTCFLARSLPVPAIIATELRTNFIPKLTEISHYKDEAEVSERLPAAVVAMKMVKLLPRNEMSLFATPILLDISQVLRSRAQESRDLARNTLAELVNLMGPSSVQFVLDALRTALTRGYQLHVMSYTVHTILLGVVPGVEIGSLDYCLHSLVRVIIDDIFGSVGQEKDNQDYVSSMKEVKGNKSYDSMELLATNISVSQISKLVAPIEVLLTGALTVKQSKQADELLRRIGIGISHNPAAGTQDVLVLAYQLVQNFYQQKQIPKSSTPTVDEQNRQRFLIQVEGKRKTNLPLTVSTTFKIVKFAIDLARSTFLRHPHLLTPANVHGFLPIVGDSLIDAQEDVKISSLRLLSSVIKLPMVELNQNTPMYVLEAVKIVKAANSTNDEIAQAALKLVTAILRDRKQVEVSDSDVSYLIHRTMPDIEEPDRQGVTFNFIKSVIARNYQIPEVYDLVDRIGMMMVTNQDRSSRDSARGIYVHFLLNYLQSKTRWSKQLKFLVKNLEYQHPEGRQSIMEAINSLILKLNTDTAQEVANTVFVPVVLRMANDEHPPCREMAGALLSRLYQMVDEKSLTALVSMLISWTEQSENLSLRKVGYQAWAIYFSAGLNGAENHVPFIRTSLAKILKPGAINDNDWALQYHALDLLLIIAREYPQHVMRNKDSYLWSVVRSALHSDHLWIQLAATKLLGLFIQDSTNSGHVNVPLTGTNGLSFDTRAVAELFCTFSHIVRNNQSNEELAGQTVQNLSILAKCGEHSDLEIQLANNDIEEEDSEPTVLPSGSHVHGNESDDAVNDGINDKHLMKSVQYLFTQIGSILRREPRKLTASSLMPKLTAIDLMIRVLAQASLDQLSETIVQPLVVPLLYITDPNTRTPRSVDINFAGVYQKYIAAAHTALEALQSKLGDVEYVKAITTASKTAKARREERRTKRRIEKVAQPEKAARDKKRKSDRNKERRKEVKGIHRSRRRADLGF